MRRLFLLAFPLLLLIACSQQSAGEGAWEYDHQRTKDKIRELWEVNLTDRRLDWALRHFKNRPPKLDLANGTYKVAGLLDAKGCTTGSFQLKGDSLRLYCRDKNSGWDIVYNEVRDEYIIVFDLYSVVLSRM
jgi:hypothetical protein